MPFITKCLDNNVSPVNNTVTLKEWETQGRKISAVKENDTVNFWVNSQSVSTLVAVHNISGIPNQHLHDVAMWKAFLSDTNVQLRVLGRDDYKLYITPRLQGGGNIEKDTTKLWPKGIVPYEIDSKKYPVGENDRQTILDAMKQWNNSGTGFQFVPRTIETDVLIFGEDDEACYSDVGYQGGEQYIRCDLDGGGFNKLSIMHEIGHAIGMYHEHQRFDRDNFVEVASGGRAVDYNKRPEQNAFGRYDLASIMHYYFDDESSTKKDKMTPKLELPEGAREKVGQVATLSPGDIAAAKELYRLSQYAKPKPAPIPTAPMSAKAAFQAIRAPLVKAKPLRQEEWVTLINRGDAYINRGKYDKALNCYTALFKEYGQHLTLSKTDEARLKNRCGVCFYYLDHYKKAMFWFDQALKITPSNQTIRNNYNQAYHEAYGRYP